jgi:hypothetical protein
MLAGTDPPLRRDQTQLRLLPRDVARPRIHLLSLRAPKGRIDLNHTATLFRERSLTVQAEVRKQCNQLQRFAQALYLSGLKADVSREFG